MITMPATAENGNREATILIRVCGIRLAAELDRSSTARAMITALPFEGRVNVWGQEIYFEIPVELPLAADASAELAVGDVAYWPQGRAMCIFFGPHRQASMMRPAPTAPSIASVGSLAMPPCSMGLPTAPP